MNIYEAIRYEDELIESLMMGGYIEDMNADKSKIVGILKGLGYQRIKIDDVEKVPYVGPAIMPAKNN